MAVKTIVANTPNIETETRDLFIKFSNLNGINFVEENESDIPDDVDESNYDPYMGCDVYDTIDLDEWSDY